MTARKGRKIEVQTPDDDSSNTGAEKAPVSNPKDQPEVVEPEIIEPETDDEGAAEEDPASSKGADAAGMPGAAGASGAADEPADKAASEGGVDEQAVADEVDEVMGNVMADSEQVAQAKKQAAEANDRYLRLQAEWDNYRKRTASERENEKQRATEHLVKDLLPVIDDFERALEHAKSDPDVKTLTEGVEAVHTKLLSVLDKEHVEVIDPLDEAFDANRHQAVGTAEDTEKYDETVTQVYQRGYEMAGHVIRPAMVIVSTGGPKRPPADETDGETEDRK